MPSAIPRNPRPRALCVDDDEDFRLMITTLLRQAFIEAKAVGTAAQALASMRTERFDLYLLPGCPILMALSCVARSAISTRTRRFSFFPARPMNLISGAESRPEPMLTSSNPISPVFSEASPSSFLMRPFPLPPGNCAPS